MAAVGVVSAVAGAASAAGAVSVVGAAGVAVGVAGAVSTADVTASTDVGSASPAAAGGGLVGRTDTTRDAAPALHHHSIASELMAAALPVVESVAAVASAPYPYAVAAVAAETSAAGTLYLVAAFRSMLSCFFESTRHWVKQKTPLHCIARDDVVLM